MSNIDMAYVKGVLAGDGSINHGNVNPRLVLDVKDKPFIEKFSKATKAMGLNPRIYTRTRFSLGIFGQMFQVYATCTPALIIQIESMPLTTAEEKLAWLKGFFDSEGSFTVKKYGHRTCSDWAISNLDYDKINQAADIIRFFGIEPKVYTETRETRMRDKKYVVTVHRLHVYRRESIAKLTSLMGGKFA